MDGGELRRIIEEWKAGRIEAALEENYLNTGADELVRQLPYSIMTRPIGYAASRAGFTGEQLWDTTGMITRDQARELSAAGVPWLKDPIETP